MPNFKGAKAYTQVCNCSIFSLHYATNLPILKREINFSFKMIQNQAKAERKIIKKDNWIATDGEIFGENGYLKIMTVLPLFFFSQRRYSYLKTSNSQTHLKSQRQYSGQNIL